MGKTFTTLLEGYSTFQEKYASDDSSFMEKLAIQGQKPETMVIACCDSRVDPSLILQADPGDLFIVRNVANIVPAYDDDKNHHGTSVKAALEYAICYLNIKHLIILGHSQCGGVTARLNDENLEQDDFITDWVSLLNKDSVAQDVDTFAKQALLQSYQNSLSFPWIKQRVEQNKLVLHLWFFDIKQSEVFAYSFATKEYKALTDISKS